MFFGEVGPFGGVCFEACFCFLGLLRLCAGVVDLWVSWVAFGMRLFLKFPCWELLWVLVWCSSGGCCWTLLFCFCSFASFLGE